MPNQGSEGRNPEEARLSEINICRQKRGKLELAEGFILDSDLDYTEKTDAIVPITAQAVENKARLLELIKDDVEQIMIELENGVEEVFGQMEELIELGVIDKGQAVSIQTIFQNKLGRDFYPSDWPEGLAGKLAELKAKYPGLEID